MECVVCLEEGLIHCTSKKCNCPICEPCLYQLIKHSRANGSLPLCPAIGCGHHYSHKPLSREVQIEYGEACLNHYKKVYSGEIDAKANLPLLTEDLRQKRLEYLSSFPPAVQLIAKIALQSKLRRVKRLELQKKATTMRKCMNTRCSGLLDANWLCSSCNTQFCGDCEKRKALTHSCKQEDLESVRAIRSMIHCPSCGLAIERSQGCNGMTCAVCHTNFDYITGQIGNHGSSNKAVSLEESPLTTLLSDVLATKTEAYRTLIIRLDKARPSVPSEKRIIDLIVRYKEEEDLSMKVLRAFDTFSLEKEAYRYYVNLVDEISHKLTQGTLSQEELRRLVETL